MSEILERMKWVPQAPDPDAAAKQEYKNLVGNFWLERLRDGDRDAMAPKPWAEWIGERKAAEKAKADAAAHSKELDESIERNAAELKELEEKLGAAEKAEATRQAAAKVKAIDEYCKAKGWDPRGPKRSKATAQMQKRGLLSSPKEVE